MNTHLLQTPVITDNKGATHDKNQVHLRRHRCRGTRRGDDRRRRHPLERLARA